MRRVLSLGIILLILISSVAAANTTNYLSASYMWSMDTNIASIPLPQNVNESWLSYRVTTPYVMKFSNGLSITNNTFFSKTGRTGLSFSFNWGKPYYSESSKPVGDFSSNWDYVKYNSIEDQYDRIFLSFGPAFRAEVKNIDFGIDLRLSVGTYSYFKEAVILGAQAYLGMNVFVSKSWFIKMGILYDGHFVRLYLNNPTTIYDDHYMMNTVGATVGIGYCFGGRAGKNEE